MNELIAKKTKSLKNANERYKLYKRFVDLYSKTKSLDEYVKYLELNFSNLNEGLLKYYESMISAYRAGDDSKLVSNLFERLLGADDNRTKIADEVKSLLGEL